MSLKIITGRSGAGKSTRVYGWVAEEAKKNPKQNYLVIVPDQFTMQTQADLVNASAGGGIMNIEVLSFSRLAYRVFGETGGDRRAVLDDTGKNLILRKCAVDVKDRIPYLAGKLDKPGYIHEVKSAISEFMQYDVDSKGMDKLIGYSKENNRKSLANKLENLSVIYDYFRDYIKENYITTEESLEILAKEIYRSKVVCDSIVIMDGFTGFTPIQNRVIGAMMDVCKRVIITLTLDSCELTEEVKMQSLFAFTHKSYMSLVGLAKDHNCELEETEAVTYIRENKELDYLEKHIFDYQADSYGDECDSIHIDAMMTTSDEVTNLARNIRRLVRDEGAYYRDIAVITGNLSAYSSEIKEKFEDYDIPVYIDETKGITLNPFIEYIKSALLILQKDFDYESIMQYLRTGFSDIAIDDADILDNYLVETGIRGKSAYSKPFAKRTSLMKKQADKGEEDAATLQLQRLNDIREKLMQELSALVGLGITRSSKHNACEYVKSLYDFLMDNHAVEKLKALELHFQALGDYSKEREYAQIYVRTMELLEQIHGLIGHEEMDIEEFYGILDAGFSEIEVGTIPQSVDRVIVGDMERTRLKSVKYLFFLGLNDGWVPKSGGNGGIISDYDREFLTESGTELAPSPRQQMYIGRFYLYTNITKPSRELYLSYAAMNNDAEAMRPSYVVDMVKKLFPLIQPSPVVSKDNDSLMAKLETKREARLTQAKLLRKKADGVATLSEEETLMGLMSYFSEEESYVKRMVDNAFYRHVDEKLDERVAGILYGTRIYASVSRMETFARCAYAYFLKYGLGLNPREEYGIEASDMGTIYHGVLEIFVDLLGEKGLDWFSMTESDAKELVDRAVVDVATKYTDAILFESERNKYIVDRMKKIMLRTVMTLSYQLKKSEFKPEAYEYKFTREQSLNKFNVGLGEEEKLYLTGKIDRMDVCRKDGRVLVKIVDYKSGNKDFSLMSFYHGLQLQMVVYMGEALKNVQEKERGSDVKPAALLYYHIDDPLVEGSVSDSDEAIEDKIRKALRTKGLVNAEDDIIGTLDSSGNEKSDVIPVERKKSGEFTAASEVAGEEEIRLLTEYANYKIRSIADRMLSGDIAVNPIELKKSAKTIEMDSCAYCDYKNVCGFDAHMPGYEKVSYDKQDDAELYKAMREELGKEGGSIDA